MARSCSHGFRPSAAAAPLALTRVSARRLVAASVAGKRPRVAQRARARRAPGIVGERHRGGRPGVRDSSVRPSPILCPDSRSGEAEKRLIERGARRGARRHRGPGRGAARNLPKLPLPEDPEIRDRGFQNLDSASRNWTEGSRSAAGGFRQVLSLLDLGFAPSGGVPWSRACSLQPARCKRRSHQRPQKRTKAAGGRAVHFGMLMTAALAFPAGVIGARSHRPAERPALRTETGYRRRPWAQTTDPAQDRPVGIRTAGNGRYRGIRSATCSSTEESEPGVPLARSAPARGLAFFCRLKPGGRS